MEKDIINILIVDDEKYEGILIEKCVNWESEGFHIIGNVQCAEDALKLMEKQVPDIVYTDINMPRIDGLELSRRIRDTYPAVRIVIVTGYREFEYAREAIHIGVEEFLLKPIQSDELLAAAMKLREQILKKRKKAEETKNAAEVVVEEDVDLDKVSIGCTVKVLDEEFDEELEFKIVGSSEANSLQGKISNESPVGKALIGKKTGDEISVETQAGEMKYQILGIQRS